eukprot:10623960-Ditylum_brightwellii.AAC.1
MKINLRSLKASNHMAGNKPLPIHFYVLEQKEKMSPSGYQVYKLCTNLKDKKYVVYSLMVGIYKVGTPEEQLQFMDKIVQVIKGQDIMELDAAYMLVKSLLCGMPYKSFKKRRQSRRKGMTQRSLNVLQQ